MDVNERDNSLKDFFKQPQELSGIFNWVLEGLKKYKKEGLIPPQEIIQSTQKYYHECDSIKLFIDTEMQPCKNNIISVASVWKKYHSEMLKDNSQYKQLGKQYFMDSIKRQPFYRKKGTINKQTHTHIICGMELK